VIPIIYFKGEKQKVCFNCKHFKKTLFNQNQFGRCKLFPKESNELVGEYKPKIKIDYYFCSTARDNDDMCGKEGFFFEKK
jgi:hypothetical protein